MKRRINIVETIDWTIIVLFLILVFIGWINIYAAVYNENMTSIFDFSFRSGKQFVWILLAFLLAIMVLVIDFRFYSFFAYFLYGFTLFLLIAVLLFGKEVNGAKSWFSVGGISIQPSEFMKLTAAMAIAKLGSSHFFKINVFKWSAISISLFAVPMLLILAQPDFGSAMVFLAFILVLYREGFSGLLVFLGFYLVVLFILSLVFSKVTVFIFSLIISFVLHYFLEKRFRILLKALFIITGIVFFLYLINHYGLADKFSLYLTLIVGTTLAAIIFLFISFKQKISYVFLMLVFQIVSVLITYSVDYVTNNILEERHRKRINIVLGLEEDPLGVGYNVNQSKIAIGSGGFSGKGFLNGTQTKFNFVPEQTTDFIFCTIGEEWGFAGTFITILIYTVFLLRLIYLAERQKSVFSRMFGYSVFTVFLLHFVINIGMTIGLMPVIGIPLPFISYGGSSLWAFTIFLFIFLRLDASRSVYTR